MMDFHVSCNINKFLKEIDDVREKQLPFAMKEAVNANAFRSRRALIKDYPRKFTMRNKGLPNLIRIDKADKKVPAARIYLDKLFMARQEYGGEKVAKPGKSVPVPREGVTSKGMTVKGAIKPGYYVSALLADAKNGGKKSRIRKGSKYSENRPSARKVSKYKPFEIERADGVKFIVRHIAGSRKLEWMYAMYPKVEVPARWNWQRIVEFFYKKYIESDFKTAYQKALKTAK